MNFEYTPSERAGQEEFAEFCRESLAPAAAELDRATSEQARSIMRDHMIQLAGEGYTGLEIPEELGGRGTSLVSSLPFHEAVAKHCPSTFLAMEASVGMVAGLVVKKGSPDQKERFAGEIMKGNMLGAVAVNEPGEGADVFAMETTAVKDRDGWILNGRKSMITNAPDADVIAVMAVTDPDAGESGFTFFLLPRETEGLQIGSPVEKMGLRGASTGDLTFRDCRLPVDSVIGDEGGGYSLYRESMTAGSIRFAALSIGIASRCLELSLKYSSEQKASGKPLFRNQEFSFKIADMQTMMDTSRQLARYAAWLWDRVNPEARALSSCAKLFAGESVVKIAHMAQQIHSEYGYLKSTEIERICRDARFCELGKGTSEVHRDLISKHVLGRFGRMEKPLTISKPHISRRIVMPQKMKKVGICAVAQTPYERDNSHQRFQGMALDILESLLEQTGLDFSEKGGITHSISVSDDVFDARTISDNAMTDVLGAHYRCEEKVAQEGAQAVYYGLATILSGQADVVLVLGHCKESQAGSRNMVTHLAFDPFYTRPLGMDFLNAAALQAQAYMAKSSVTDRHLAGVVARARRLGSKNPFISGLLSLTEEEVLRSPMLADPIRELHAYPVSDGAVGMILASEERAGELTDTPVWITGTGNCFDAFFLGDRDPTGNFALGKAAERAFRRAGISNPRNAFDVIEISDQYAYQQPMWMEGLGLCEDEKGGNWLDEGGPDRCRVNTSGGMLAGNPMILGGLVRVAEAALQLMGKAEDRQVPDARKALAHGVMGPAGQFHTVIILESG